MKKWQWMTTGALLGSVVLSLTFVGIKSQSELAELRKQNEELKQRLAEETSTGDSFFQKPSNSSPFAFGSPLLNDPFANMRQRMDQFFEDSFFDHGFDDSWQATIPSVEVEDLRDKYLVLVQPFDPERYQVVTEIEGKYLKLNISSKNHTTEESQSDEGSYTRQFSGNSQITKQVYLREPIEPDEMEISIEENLLEIEIPKIS